MELIKVHDEESGEFIYMPLPLLLTSEFFRNLNDASPVQEELKVNDFDMNLWTFVRIVNYDMARSGIELSVEEIGIVDKFLMKSDLAEMGSDRKIQSGLDSRKLYTEIDNGEIDFETLIPEFQYSVILEAVLDHNPKFLVSHIDYFSEVLRNDTWIFYPNYTWVYNEIRIENSELQEVFDRILSTEIVPSNVRLKEVLLKRVEPYLLNYIRDPTSYKEGISKDIYWKKKDEKDFILTSIIGRLDFNLARRLISNGLNVNLTMDRYYNLLGNTLEYMDNLDSYNQDPTNYHIDKLSVIEFTLDTGYNDYRQILVKLLDIIYEMTDSMLTYDQFRTTNEYRKIAEILQKLRRHKNEIDIDSFRSDNYYQRHSSKEIFDIMLDEFYFI